MITGNTLKIYQRMMEWSFYTTPSGYAMKRPGSTNFYLKLASCRKGKSRLLAANSMDQPHLCFYLKLQQPPPKKKKKSQPLTTGERPAKTGND